jgi:cytochrome c-type biogenesis protein CcmH/NrfG
MSRLESGMWFCIASRPEGGLQMSLMLHTGWILVVSSLVTFALLLFPRRTTGSRTVPLNVEACKARLDEIEARLKCGNVSAAEADAARLALLAQLRSSSWGIGQGLGRAPRTLIAPAAIFLLIVGVGASYSQLANTPEARGSADANPTWEPPLDGEMLASLTDFTRSVGAAGAETPADGNLLPDVNVMIERLAARLQTDPGDVNGWRMLGWSYLNMQRYEQAAAAYAKAVELDPSSAELKSLYEDAKRKTANSGSLQTGAITASADGLGAKATTPEGTSLQQSDAAIREMVDGLATRLESSPRDVEGWMSLMRSRVVLGEKEVAATAFRKALDVFKDDAAAAAKIMATAVELGLKTE